MKKGREEEKDGRIASTKGKSEDQKCSRKKEEDAKLLDRCEAKKKEWAKLWQCDESVQNMADKPWNNEELKKLEEALTKAKRV